MFVGGSNLEDILLLRQLTTPPPFNRKDAKSRKENKK